MSSHGEIISSGHRWCAYVYPQSLKRLVMRVSLCLKASKSFGALLHCTSLSADIRGRLFCPHVGLHSEDVALRIFGHAFGERFVTVNLLHVYESVTG